MTLTKDKMDFVIESWDAYKKTGKDSYKMPRFKYDDKYNHQYTFVPDSDGICSSCSLYEYGHKIVSFEPNFLDYLLDLVNFRAIALAKQKELK